METPVLELRKLADVPLWEHFPGQLGKPAKRRALRFGHPTDRDAFVSGRIALQRFAASLLDVDASRLVPDYRCPQCGPGQDHGRPWFRLDGGPAPLVLSASRASGWVLLAGVVHPAEGQRLGVDLETIAGTDFAGFGDVALTDGERTFLTGVPAPQQARQRARLWARKEAWLKMTGEGLRRNPSELDVLELPGLADITALANDEEGLPAGLVAALASG